ncbi:NAD(P)/FAD-dependent oxidoreductase [Halorussus halobius]|uniref:NAD(P)/FAD-dependent oxidoreductase n=1 Tax=Halorussus halobius TaxID=1710537 RepID=UPI001091E800|nr:NAD(P)/FAD-dependent oxidoreductase [Halorussus halobius]
MTRTPDYEVVVVGGGPAGMTVALYATRLGHRTALVDREGGRYESVAAVHNLLGVSEETSGREVTELGIEQLTEYGADYYADDVREVDRVDPGEADADAESAAGGRGFRIVGDRATLRADRVVLATGFTDVPPQVRGLRRFVGRGLHYCVHCDAYALGDEPVFVLGTDDHAAQVALLLLNFTADVDLLLDDAEPAWSESVAEQVAAHPVDVVDDRVDHAFADDAEDASNPPLGGLEFGDGRTREYAGGFAIHGREYNNGLAADLGCDLEDDGAIAVDENRETSVAGVYAVGDVTHGQNQTPVALGDGAYAGIALHEDLRTFPVAADELDRLDDLDAPAMADDLRARMRRVREVDDYAGMTPEER